jgi:prophage regulatory protein
MQHLAAPTEKRRPRRLLSYEELKPQKDIPYSRPHLHRLIKAGKFPRPIKLGENRNAWIESEVDEYIESRIAARETASV